MQSQESAQKTSQGQISRRRFLKQIGIGTGAVVLTCAGATAITTYAPPVICPESEGDAAASRRVLITYASCRGSTGEVAQTIAETLIGRGFSVDLHPISKVTDLSGYNAVLVGSAIRVGKWLPEAAKFVEAHRDTLSRIPTSYFTVCMTLARDTQENRSRAYAFLEPVRQILQPVKEGWFAGKYDPNTCALWERLAVASHHMPEGDFRNWDTIRAWAGQVL